MADPGELILVRLPIVCAGVTGITTVASNQSDIPVTARPGIIINDGAEQFLDAPRGEHLSRVQRVELSPEIRILVRADNGAEARTLLRLFRNRVVVAVLSDATLRQIADGIRFDASSTEPPTPDSKEPWMSLNFVFRYVFRLIDIS